MKTPQFHTFTALATYARERAVRSAKRNDPIAWAYWKTTEEFAVSCQYPIDQSGFSDDQVAEARMKEEGLLRDAHMKEGEWFEAALYHSHVKWCAAILRAHGRRVRVSLDWMREVKP